MKHICQVWSVNHWIWKWHQEKKYLAAANENLQIILASTRTCSIAEDPQGLLWIRCPLELFPALLLPTKSPHTYTEQHYTPVLIVSFFHVFDDTKCRGRLYFRLYITHHPLTCKATFWHSERHRVGEAAAALYLSGTMQKLGSMLHHGLPRAPLPYPLQPEGSGLSFSYFSILSFSILVCMLWYDNPIAPYFVFYVTF